MGVLKIIRYSPSAHFRWDILASPQQLNKAPSLR